MFVLEEEKYLPYSGCRYKLNKFGEILDINSKIIKTRIVNGKKIINLIWIDGITDYEVGNIIAIIIFNIKIPTQFWNRVEAIYNDGCTLNTNIYNISYRFKNGPIEVEGYPGFFYIPYYTNYAISLDGQLLNLKRFFLHSWNITSYQIKKNIKGGYRVCRAIRDKGNTGHISRHRAIGLTFLKYDINPSYLVINHKDGIPGNDFPKNLEWITRAENNQHAYDSGLMLNKVVKILMKDLNTGVIEKYSSLAECSRKIEKSEGFIRGRLREQNTRYSDGITFKLDDNSEWPILNNKIVSALKRFSFIARNVFTGELVIFDNAREMSDFTKVSDASIINHASQEKLSAINGFNFRYLDSKISWPNHNEKHLRIYKCFPYNPPNGILIKNSSGEEINFFESFELAAKAYNLSVSSITLYCNNNKPLNDNFLYLYKLTENLGPPIE